MPQLAIRPAPLLMVLLVLLVLAGAAWLGLDRGDEPTAGRWRVAGPPSAAPPRLEGAPVRRAGVTEATAAQAAGAPAVSAADLTIAGTVVRADGAPVGAGHVEVAVVPKAGSGHRVAEHRAPIEAEGRFRLEGLPPGRVRLSVVPYDRTEGTRVSAVTDAGDEAIRLVLGAVARTCRVRLTVVDGGTGKAPVYTRLAVHVTADGEESVWRCELESLEKPPTATWLGDYEAVPGSTCILRVVALGYRQTEPLVVEVPADAEVHPVEVTLQPAHDEVAHLVLHLVTSGRPTPEIVTGFADHPDIPIHLEHLVENDRVTVRMPAGQHALTIETGGDYDDAEDRGRALVADVTVELAAGERREVEVPLQVGGFVFLVGDPDAWAPEFAFGRGKEAIVRHARAAEVGDEDGFLLGPIAPGKWTLTYDGTDRLWRGEVEIRAGETTRIHRDDL